MELSWVPGGEGPELGCMSDPGAQAVSGLMPVPSLLKTKMELSNAIFVPSRDQAG